MLIAVVGNVTEGVSLNVPRFPEAGETLIASGAYRDCGKGVNQAVAAGRTSHGVAFVGALGRGGVVHLGATLAREDLDPAHLHIVGLSTEESFIFVRSDAEYVVVSTASCACALPPELGQDLRAVSGDTVLVQGSLSLATTRRGIYSASLHFRGVLPC